MLAHFSHKYAAFIVNAAFRNACHISAHIHQKKKKKIYNHFDKKNIFVDFGNFKNSSAPVQLNSYTLFLGSLSDSLVKCFMLQVRMGNKANLVALGVMLVSSKNPQKTVLR